VLCDWLTIEELGLKLFEELDGQEKADSGKTEAEIRLIEY
jgi:hypothetical protein